MRKHARAIITVFDCAWMLLIAVIFALALPHVAYAYVDPSVMTYTIQALAGVAVALGAVAGVAFRRTRKALFKFLKIDENANKIVEAPVARCAVGDAPKARVYACDPTTQAKGVKSLKPLNYGGRFWRALIVCFFLVFTIFIVAPLEIIAGANSELRLSISDVTLIFVAVGVGIAVCSALLVALLRGKPYYIALGLITVIGVCAWVQAMWLNAGIGTADGTSIVLSEHLLITVVSTAFWVCAIIVMILVLKYKARLFRPLCIGLSCALIVVQGIGFASVLTSGAATKDASVETFNITKKGLYDLSSKNNVVVFLLDTCDAKEAEEILADYPKMLDGFEDFTMYDNVAGSMAPTRYAVPYLLTGELMQADETFEHYLETRYTRSTFLDDLSETGYSIGVYTDNLWGGLETVSKYAMNILSETSQHKTNINPYNAVGIMYKAALYREMPWLLKPFFWFYTDDINNAVVEKSSGERDYASEPYTINDISYHQDIVDNGITVNDDEVGSFRLIHMNGVHPPYIMDEEGWEAHGDSTVEKTYVGSLSIMRDYVNQLKAAGLYDNTTIIITADHGAWHWEEEKFHTPGLPFVLVKKAGERAPEGAKCKVSSASLAQGDTLTTILEAMGADGSKYGISFWAGEENNDPSRTRTYIHTTHNGTDDLSFIEYKITGDAKKFRNWKSSGKVWEGEKPTV